MTEGHAAFTPDGQDNWTEDKPPDQMQGAARTPPASGIVRAVHGQGVGKLLTLAGLYHLATRVAEVLLDVESDSATAIAVHSGLGFRHEAADTHVMYRRDSDA